MWRGELVKLLTFFASLSQEINFLYQYVKQAVRDADGALNDQWAAFSNKGKTVLQQKSRKRIEVSLNEMTSTYLYN